MYLCRLITLQLNDFIMRRMFITQWLVFVSVLTAVAQGNDSISVLPFSTDFSTSEGWQLNNGTCLNYWTIGTVGSNNALFVTNNGTTPTYSYTRSAIAAEKPFVVGDADKIIVSFDLKCGGDYDNDFLKMFLAPPSETYQGGFIPSWTYDSDSLYAANFSDHYDMTNTPGAYPYIINLTRGKTIHLDVRVNNPIANPDTNSIAKLVFGWVNDYGSTYDHGIQPAPTITNLRLKRETCTPLTGLSVSNIQSHSVELSWNMPEGGASNYIVQYAKDGQNWNYAYITTVNVQDTSVTLTGLQSITKYWVRVARNCGSDTSVWIKQSFTTLCEYIDTLPYICDLSHVSSTMHPIPVCWERGPGSCCDPAIHYGAINLWIPNTISMPHLNRQLIDINTVELSFSARSETNNGTLIIGVMTDASADSTFVAVDTLSLTTSYETYLVPINGYTGVGDRVSFKCIDHSDIYVKDVILDYTLSCPRPYDLESANPTHNSIDLSWTGTSSSCNVYYKADGDESYSVASNITAGVGQPFTLSGLASSTIYQWYVAAQCYDSTEAASHELSFFETFCDPINQLPVTWDFEYYNNETKMPLCWKNIGDADIREGNAHSGTHSMRLYSNNSPCYVVLPKVENNLYHIDNMQIRFFAMNTGTVSDFHVRVIGGVITNPENSANFIPNDTIDVIGAAGGSFQEYTLRLSDYYYYPNDAYPAIKFVGINGTWLLIDDLTLEVVDSTLLPDCPSLTTLETTNISQTTATLNAAFENPDNMSVSAVGFKWKDISSSAYTQVDCSVSNNVFATELDGLTANTTYAYKAFVTYYGITVLSEETIFTTLPENDTIEDHVDEYLLSCIKLYPNPANEYIDVQCTMNDVQLESVEVIDVYGKVVHAIVGANNHSPLQTRINVSGLAGGIYFVRLTTDKGMVIKKFVKE